MKKNRVQCWLCRSWVAEEHSVEEMFLQKPEKVCIICFEKLKEQDDRLDMMLQVQKDISDAKGNAATLPGERTGGTRGLEGPAGPAQAGKDERK